MNRHNEDAEECCHCGELVSAEFDETSDGLFICDDCLFEEDE